MNINYTLLAAVALLGGAAVTTTGCKSCSCGDMMSHEHKTAAVKPYPLQTCIVSGEKLGEMGEPVVFIKDGQEIKLCCKNCKPKFDAEPDKYLSQLNAAAGSEHSAHH
ncbi:MAG TPA: hypothetical protein VMB21_11635 [Candidatus Limnocylindria bacterium]|jgi:hypothetical protein|nr:hypothetical protein [Candidatus Limnocylindria bacterium]